MRPVWTALDSDAYAVRMRVTIGPGVRWSVMVLLALVPCACAAYVPIQPDERLLARDIGELMGRRFDACSAEGFELLEGTVLRLSFREDEDTNVHFSAGCNGFSGRATLRDGRLIIPGVMRTELGCGRDHSAQDAWLMRFFLKSKPAVVLQGRELTLTSADAMLVCRE